MMHHDDRICVFVCWCIGHNHTMGPIAGRRVLNIPGLCCPVMGVGVSFNVLPWRRFWPCCIGRCFFVVLSLNFVNQATVQQGIWGHVVIHCVTEGVSGLYLYHCPIRALLMMDGLWAGMRGPFYWQYMTLSSGPMNGCCGPVVAI